MKKTRDPLTIDEAQQVLMRTARNVGRAYSVTMSVGRFGEALIFVDDLGEPIVDEFSVADPDNEDTGYILAASADEIRSAMFLKVFAARALYAALVQKTIDILASEEEAKA